MQPEIACTHCRLQSVQGGRDLKTGFVEVVKGTMGFKKGFDQFQKYCLLIYRGLGWILEKPLYYNQRLLVSKYLLGLAKRAFLGSWPAKWRCLRIGEPQPLAKTWRQICPEVHWYSGRGDLSRSVHCRKWQRHVSWWQRVDFQWEPHTSSKQSSRHAAVFTSPNVFSVNQPLGYNVGTQFTAHLCYARQV